MRLFVFVRVRKSFYSVPVYEKKSELKKCRARNSTCCRGGFIFFPLYSLFFFILPSLSFPFAYTYIFNKKSQNKTKNKNRKQVCRVAQRLYVKFTHFKQKNYLPKRNTNVVKFILNNFSTPLLFLFYAYVIYCIIINKDTSTLKGLFFLLYNLLLQKGIKNKSTLRNFELM